MKNKKEKIVLTVRINRGELSEFIKQKMLRDGYPEEDLKEIEEFLDEGDIARYCFDSMVEAEDIDID